MKASAPTISVLMPAYNRAQYIGAAIESVLGQTYEDFELIVVDDRSTDATLAIARAQAARDPRVRVVANERNLGQFANRNYTASLARGRFLKYHDSDDVMYPHCLGTMLAALESESRAGFALSTGGAWRGGPCPMLLSPRMCYEREFLGTGMFMAGPAGALFRADVFRALGGFEDHGVPSDFVFWLRACKSYSVLLVPGDLFWYREHGGQELRSPRAARERVHAEALAWQSLHAADCPLDPRDLQQARCNYAFILAREIWRELRAGNPGLALYRVRVAGLSLAEWMRYLRRPQRSWRAGSPLTPDGDFVMPQMTRPESERVAR